MIAFIEGILADITENTIVINCSGLGYELFVPQTLYKILPPIGGRLKLYTYLQVKEDGIALFGFSTKDDLAIFKLLITVNGIGPKGAIGILTVLTADELRFAVFAQDAKTIAKAPGIGLKTAGKLILELKDKLKLEDVLEREEISTPEIGEHIEYSKKKEEAIQALIALGYSATDALRAVKQVEITKEMTAETILKQSLRKIGL